MDKTEHLEEEEERGRGGGGIDKTCER